jgi:zinc transporter
LEALESRYGSDQNGLVWGYRFTPGHAATPLDSAGAAEWLAAEQTPPESFVWLHFSLSNANAESWMGTRLGLPDSFLEALHQPIGSTRLEQEGNSLVAVIHDVLFDFTFDAAGVSTVILCLEPRLLVSARLKPLRSVDKLRTSVKSGETFRSSAELLSSLLRDQSNVLVDILRKSTARVDAIEDTLLDNRLSANRKDLGSLRRVLVRLQRLLAPEPAALFRLLNRPPAWMTELDVQDLREAAEEFSTAANDSAALVERVKLLQEEVAASVNEQTNGTLFVLTMVTVLALPINLISGMFGMNVGGVPLSEKPHGFLVIVTITGTLTALLTWWALGRRRS